MSFAGSFQAIAARYGQTVTLWRDGENVGMGRNFGVSVVPAKAQMR